MNVQNPKVSVIIPCYNLGQYVDEAVESVLGQTLQDFEIIIVNDGSTDENTNEILRNYDRPKTRVITTENQGVSAARNTGIKACSGEYILCLDADDKIGNTYLEKAVEVLDNNENVGIVYCEVEFFGERSGKWELPKYHFPSILLFNCIHSVGMYRKSDWQKTGGYNSNMIYGWEDYDFWLYVIELGREVVRLPEVLLYYRQRSDSRDKAVKQEQFIQIYSQIFRNHQKLYADNIEVVFKHILDLRSLSWQLEDKLEESRAEVTILALNLQEINLIIFPDWCQSEEGICSELARIILAVTSDTERNKIALLIDTSNLEESGFDGNLILASVAMSILMENDLDVSENLEILLLDKLKESEWRALLPRIKYRLILERENEQAIAKVGADNLPACEVEALSNLL